MTSQITSHVLDSSVGLAAAGIRIRLRSLSGQELGEAVTDADGRVTELGPPVLPAGTYELVFETGAYFAARGVATFYPHITVAITVSGRPFSRPTRSRSAASKSSSPFIARAVIPAT